MTDIGSVFRTQVPSYEEAADIRKAFNLYHYGEETAPAGVEELNPNSIAGYLQQLTQDVADVQSGISNVTQLAANQNLNEIYQNGFYLSTATALFSLGYPEEIPGSSADSGYLHVVSKVDPTNSSRLFVFQKYHTLGQTGSDPNLYWRSGSRVNNVITWTSSWKKVSADGHLHNTTYYTIAQIDNKIATTLLASRAAVTDSTGRLSSSSITAAELEKLDGADNLAGTIEAELNDRARATHYHDDRYYLRSSVSNPQPGAQKTVRIFVQQAQPTGAQVNDLWFW
jgi:hypothetical protein